MRGHLLGEVLAPLLGRVEGGDDGQTLAKGGDARYADAGRLCGDGEGFRLAPDLAGQGKGTGSEGGKEGVDKLEGGGGCRG